VDRDAGIRHPCQTGVPQVVSTQVLIPERGDDFIPVRRIPKHRGTWADWLGVPRHTFSTTFGAVIARGGDYRETFQHFRPDFDLERERRLRLEAGLGEFFNARDLYPDVRPALTELRQAGYFIGIAGNQTQRAGRLIGELNLPVDLIATSDDWGAEKPSVEFFHKLVSESGFRAGEIVYVGDRLDNDIRPRIRSRSTHGLDQARPLGLHPSRCRS
jgi:HAD superfamily hydrolase (TIGR01549 family)